MQYVFHSKPFFDELEVVMKITTSSKSSHRLKKQLRDMMLMMQWFKFSSNDMIKLLTRELPLVVFLYNLVITRFPN
jgi:hypothetical protein